MAQTMILEQELAESSRLLASVTLSKSCSWRNQNIELVTRIDVFPDEKHGACCADLHTSFQLKRASSANQEAVGSIKGYMIDKRITKGTRTRRRPLWQDSILLAPLYYPHSRTDHAAGDDPQSDVQKIFQMIYQVDGTVKEAFDEWQDILDGDRVHFIDAFEVLLQFRGTGMARLAMDCYKDALEQLNNGHAFDGTIILSPAALRNEYDEAQARAKKTGKQAKDFLEVEDALVRGYQKDGFAVWHRGDRKAKGAAITIMGMSLSRSTSSTLPSAQPPQPIQPTQPKPADPTQAMSRLSLTPSVQSSRRSEKRQSSRLTSSLPSGASTNDESESSSEDEESSEDDRQDTDTQSELNGSSQSVPLSAGQNGVVASRAEGGTIATPAPALARRGVSRMLAELQHKDDQNGINPYMEADDGQRYSATNGSRYQMRTGTLLQWIKRDSGRGQTTGFAAPVNSPRQPPAPASSARTANATATSPLPPRFHATAATTAAFTRPTASGKRSATNASVGSIGHKRVRQGQAFVSTTTGMDALPASRSAEPIEGWHPDSYWAVEDFLDARANGANSNVTEVLVDWAEYHGTRWDPTWETVDKLNQLAKEKLKQWRRDTGRSLAKKDR